jgi:hypothetical protein
MIQASELRIGNYVIEKGRRPFTISIEKICDFGNGFYKFEPVPLTEEWLIKFGFVAYAKHCNYTELCIKSDNPSKHIVVRIGLQIKYFTVFNHSECDFTEMQYLTTLHYVHQLQNLYFALTQKELTI